MEKILYQLKRASNCQGLALRHAPSEEEEEKETHLLKAGGKITTHNEMISVDEDNTEQEVTIDVDACKPNLEWPNSWLANLPVSQVHDKITLTTPGAWLSDAIMNAAQTILKKENPFVFSLQNVNLGVNIVIMMWKLENLYKFYTMGMVIGMSSQPLD